MPQGTAIRLHRAGVTNAFIVDFPTAEEAQRYFVRQRFRVQSGKKPTSHIQSWRDILIGRWRPPTSKSAVAGEDLKSTTPYIPLRLVSETREKKSAHKRPILPRPSPKSSKADDLGNIIFVRDRGGLPESVTNGKETPGAWLQKQVPIPIPTGTTYRLHRNGKTGAFFMIVPSASAAQTYLFKKSSFVKRSGTNGCLQRLSISYSRTNCPLASSLIPSQVLLNGSNGMGWRKKAYAGCGSHRQVDSSLRSTKESRSNAKKVHTFSEAELHGVQRSENNEVPKWSEKGLAEDSASSTPQAEFEKVQVSRIQQREQDCQVKDNRHQPFWLPPPPPVLLPSKPKPSVEGKGVLLSRKRTKRDEPVWLQAPAQHSTPSALSLGKQSSTHHKVRVVQHRMPAQPHRYKIVAVPRASFPAPSHHCGLPTDQKTMTPASSAHQTRANGTFQLASDSAQSTSRCTRPSQRRLQPASSSAKRIL